MARERVATPASSILSFSFVVSAPSLFRALFIRYVHRWFGSAWNKKYGFNRLLCHRAFTARSQGFTACLLVFDGSILGKFLLCYLSQRTVGQVSDLGSFVVIAVWLPEPRRR